MFGYWQHYRKIWTCKCSENCWGILFNDSRYLLILVYSHPHWGLLSQLIATFPIAAPLLSEVFLIKLFNSHHMSIVFFLVFLLLFYLFISTFLELPLYFFDFVDIVPLELEGFILFFHLTKRPITSQHLQSVLLNCFPTLDCETLILVSISLSVYLGLLIHFLPKLNTLDICKRNNLYV